MVVVGRERVCVFVSVCVRMSVCVVFVDQSATAKHAAMEKLKVKIYFNFFQKDKHIC